jgi:hypothetical protein
MYETKVVPRLAEVRPTPTDDLGRPARARLGAADEPDRSRDEPDGPWDEDPFDPDNAPPDGEEAFLADLPAELAEEYLSAPWAGEGEAIAAGFLHHTGGRRGSGFAAGGALDQLAPGPVLAGFVAEAAGGLAGLGESALIGFLCASRRMASWAAAQEVEAVITLCRRRAEQPRKLKNKHLIEHVADEIAAALTLTRRAANRLVSVCGYLERLPDVRASLAAGIIDWPRAVVFADELAALDDEAAREIAGRVLPRAGEMTTSQLRRALRRAVEAHDPDAARRRRELGRKDAAVHLWTESSGNSALAGREMTPADALAADARLTAQAKWLKARGAEGTLDQLREAVFSAVLNGRDITTLLPDSPDSQTEPGSPADPAITGSVHLTMPVSAYLWLTDRPGEVAGSGPAAADTCRDLADRLAADPATRWCLTLTDPDGRAVAHACARHGPHGPPRPPRSKDPPSPRITGWLARLRPVFLETGTCTHERQAPGYRPPPSLRHLITIRQPTCAEPGCLRPGQHCDLDHTIAFDRGGRTCECNISPLCRHGHQAKQAPGWHLDQPEPGLMIWTLPSGRTYTTRPGTYPV